MVLTLSALLGLALTCAPAVAPETLLSVASAESGFDALLVAVNTRPRRVFHPDTRAAATQLAARLIRDGLSVDLGLGQINSRNLARLGLSPTDAFDPCRNLAASSRLLREGYERAAPPGADDTQAALRTALSLYNTGDTTRGLRNGYVARVTAAATHVVPAIAPILAPARTDAPAADPASPGPAASPPALDIFARPTAAAVAVF